MQEPWYWKKNLHVGVGILFFGLMLWSLRMANEITKLLKTLNELYGTLSTKQAEYLSMDTTKPE